MKKLLALALIVVCIFAFASCEYIPFLNQNKEEEVNEPENIFTDIEKAAKRLEKNDDYYVRYSDDKDDINHPGMVEFLYASGEDEDLAVVVFDNEEFAALYYESMMIEYNSGIASLENEIKVIEFTLENYEDDLDNDEIDEYEDELKELKKELEEMKEDYVVAKSGKTVWVGTKNIIEDAQG